MTKKAGPRRTKQKQFGFEILEHKAIKKFGGSLLTSHPKSKRPISFKKTLHLVMRSSLAKGARSFYKKDAAIYALIQRQAKRFGVKIYRFANGGNHLHLVILAQSRESYVCFVRSVSGLTARLIMNKQRGAARAEEEPNQVVGATQGFWDRRPYTSIVEWGRHFKNVCRYLDENLLEAIGFPYAPRSLGGPKQRREYRRSVLYG
ncbi:MAG: hypothetical protein COT74_12415 [Bdellovibrionales bacterium CG10_big_fil_rev_8_21_14_0_10_45_34]|nr:MAG: hypothetical protein COT74_12415 [Bdellovibrionales bacterium CG10_big_fil_rev_8_21_14_0_10_45_34]